MRRPYIYPHRSVRALPLGADLVAAGVTTAVALTLAVWYFRAALAEIHAEVALRLCRLAGLHAANISHSVVFGIPLTIPTIPAGQVHEAIPWLTAALVAGLCAVVGRFLPLARGLLVFVIVMLAMSCAALLTGTLAAADVNRFVTLWTQTEILVWLVLPSVTAFLFVIMQSSLLRGIAWMLSIQAFAVLWSAVRLVALIGVGYYTGTVLLPSFWFGAGLLADVLYLVTFYAWSIHVTLNVSEGR